jgi:hypothetical protein
MNSLEPQVSAPTMHVAPLRDAAVGASNCHAWHAQSFIPKMHRCSTVSTDAYIHWHACTHHHIHTPPYLPHSFSPRRRVDGQLPRHGCWKNRGLAQSKRNVGKHNLVLPKRQRYAHGRASHRTSIRQHTHVPRHPCTIHTETHARA